MTNMAPTLLQLPPELLWQIQLWLCLRDRMQLSATCNGLHAAAIHQWGIFKSICFSARSAASADSALEVAGQYPGLVQKLKLVIGPAPYNRGDPNPAPIYENLGLLPESALALLRGYCESEPGQQLAPGLKKLAVEFPDAYTFRKHLGRPGVSMYMVFGRDKAPEFAHDNNTMADHVLQALAHTTHPVEASTRLSILNLPPHSSPVLGTHQWHQFMGRLHSLELSVFGEQHGFYLTSNGDRSYGDFVDSLSDDFLDTRQVVCGSLPSLDLVYATADRCGVTWGEFFKWLINFRIQIRSFRIRRRRRAECLEETEESDDNDNDNDNSDGDYAPPAAHATAEESPLEAQSRHCRWPYVFIAGDSGHWVKVTYRNESPDQAAYDEFMDTVAANGDGAASGDSGSEEDGEDYEGEVGSEAKEDRWGEREMSWTRHGRDAWAIKR
ncbi:hypothetical protein MAPG_05983 [Magnaporthiopsis poae ATCC 64411]|uniref:F-box domain-containing protein n=1 Tax=Magnaporthiopsis poae (strain ATCC 64411 / 73-15) TaxID=644358 RepID=A0A0C4E0U6_MAGP6|nr:hypothetical protein MAPG_05983 [Magnaporthiopsis poae ATCC 64411]